jgi:hypothetical protein
MTPNLDELERLKSGEAAAPIDLDELERRAKGTDGMLLMSETVLTLIAAARERDALKLDNERLQAVLSMPEVYAGVITEEVERHAFALAEQFKRERDALRSTLEALENALNPNTNPVRFDPWEYAKDALAQHRGEAGEEK